MTEKIEMGNISPEQNKITNLAELKALLEKEFGKYFFFLKASLKRLSGYKASGSIFPDVKREEELEKTMLEHTQVTPEIIKKINEIIAYRAESMEQEIIFAKERNEEKHLKECQEIFDLFKNKRLFLNEKGIINIEKIQ